MTDTLVLKSGLRMPSSFVEVKDDEMEYLEGGFFKIAAAIFGIVCGVCTAVAGILTAIDGGRNGNGLVVAIGWFTTVAGFAGTAAAICALFPAP